MSGSKEAQASPPPPPPETDEAKKQEVEEGLDLDSLDDLEKNFQRVITDLVTDKSLDTFRVEYEKIHAAFVKSHANNAELVKRCRALNSEILANSTKVNSILQLSQDDQRTIAGLRFEFDKAWKMVELSQEKENKSRDVIDQMKLEVSNLSKLVETGGAMALTQETSLQSIQDEVKNLQKEINLQSTQITSLLTDFQTSSSKNKEIAVQINSLKEEQDTLQKELDEQREVAKSLDVEADAKSKEMAICKNECKIAQEDSDNNMKRNASAKKKNISLSSALVEENRNLRDVNEDRKDQIARLAVVQKILEDKKRLGGRLVEQQLAIQEKIKAKDLKKLNHIHQLSEITKEKEVLVVDLDKINIEKKEAEEALEETHQDLNRLRDEVYRLTHDYIRKESQIAGTNRSIALLQRQNTKGKNEVFDEKRKALAVEGQRDGIENDLLGIKANAHKNRMAVEQVKNEIEHYSRAASDNKSNLLVVEVDRKIKEDEILELDMLLRERRVSIAKQVTLAETVLQQRDFLRQQVEALQADCLVVEDDNKTLVNEIRGMKELIRQKDTECVSAHLKKNQIETSLVDLRRGNAKLSVDLKEAVQTQCTLENKLMRSRYLRDVALQDLSMLKRANERLESDYRLLELSIHKKSFEASKLKEKCRVLTSTITSTAETYTTIVKKAEALKEDLTFDVKKFEKLRDRTHHSEMLKLESLRLEKAKLLTQGKVRALEDELETPMMIHRWRFLEGTNPEAANLIKMTHVLRSKLMLKLAVLQRYRGTFQIWEEKVKMQAKHIHQTSVAEHKESIKFFENILHQKSQQLEMLTSQIDGQQETVDDSKSNVETIRQQLRDSKIEFYNDKKVSDKYRASSQMQRKSTIQPNGEQTSKFIGGGFAYAQVQKSLQFAQPPKPLVNIGSTIVMPKVSNNSRASKQNPKGWNPGRAPLKPLLPTVSELKPE